MKIWFQNHRYKLKKQAFQKSSEDSRESAVYTPKITTLDSSVTSHQPVTETSLFSPKVSENKNDFHLDPLAFLPLQKNPNDENHRINFWLSAPNPFIPVHLSPLYLSSHVNNNFSQFKPLWPFFDPALIAADPKKKLCPMCSNSTFLHSFCGDELSPFCLARLKTYSATSEKDRAQELNKDEFITRQSIPFDRSLFGQNDCNSLLLPSHNPFESFFVGHPLWPDVLECFGSKKWNPVRSE